jgi:hypothetical protein
MNDCIKCNNKYDGEDTVKNLPNRFESFLYDSEVGKYNCETCLFGNEATNSVIVKRVTECKDSSIEHTEMIDVKCCERCKKNILSIDECVYKKNYYSMIYSLTNPDYTSESELSEEEYEYDDYDDYNDYSDEMSDESQSCVE